MPQQSVRAVVSVLGQGPEGRRRAVRHLHGRARHQHRGHRAARRPRLLRHGHAGRPEGPHDRPVGADHRPARAGQARSTWRCSVHLHSERRKKQRRDPRQQGAALPRAAHRRPPPRQAARRDRRRLRQPPGPRADRQGGRPAVLLVTRTTTSTSTSTGCSTTLKQHQADLVVLARYMRILPPKIVAGVPPPDHQHPPVAAAVLPRGRPVQAGVRVAASACTAAPPTSSPSSSTRGRSSCRTSSTSTSAPTRWTT